MASKPPILVQLEAAPIREEPREGLGGRSPCPVGDPPKSRSVGVHRAQAAVAQSTCSDAKAVTRTADHPKHVGQQGFATWEEAYKVETFSESESMSDVAVGKRKTSDDFAFGAASELNRPRRDLRRPTEDFQALKTAVHGSHRKDQQLKTPSQPEADSVEKERRVPKPDRPRKQPTGPY